MSRIDEGLKTFTAGGAISARLRVTLAAGVLVVAGVTDREVGTLRDAAFASGDFRAVYLTSKQGTAEYIANGPLAIGDEVFSAAAGKVGPYTPGSFSVGIAMSATSADGDMLEVLRHYNSSGGVRAFTAGGAIAANLRVKLTAGKLAIAGVGDKDLGSIAVAALANNDVRAVFLRNRPGTVFLVANGALAAGVEVWTAANGKVGAASTGAFLLGTALSTTAADGDSIEILRNSHGDSASA